MRLLFPITQAVAALVSAALAMLLLAQRAKDTAILRVLGISRSQTRWMLGVEPVLAALLGVGLGVLVAFLLLGEAGPGDLLPDQPGAVPGRVSPGYHSGHSPRRKPQAPGATPGERMRRRTHDV